MEKRYWTNFIIQHDEHSKPWRCSSYDCCKTLEEAIKLVVKQRDNYRVLAAWIDEESSDGIRTVYHDCYLDAVGNLIYEVLRPNRKKGENT